MATIHSPSTEVPENWENPGSAGCQLAGWRRMGSILETPLTSKVLMQNGGQGQRPSPWLSETAFTSSFLFSCDALEHQLLKLAAGVDHADGALTGCRQLPVIL